MKIINVISFDSGVLSNIDSFGIFEEQLSEDVVAEAEKVFIEKAKAIGFNEEDSDVDSVLENGFYDSPNCHQSVFISWSYI
jgi:hypothetical protein